MLFDDSIDGPSANFLIRQAGELTYRQYLVLALVAYRSLSPKYPELSFRVYLSERSDATPVRGAEVTVHQEVADLQRRRLVDGNAGVPNMIQPTDAGVLFAKTLGLIRMDPDHLAALEELVNGDATS